jgi:integrase
LGYVTAILTDMRRGELVGLQWSDIDFNHNQIHIRRAFCNTSKAFVTPKTKNSKRRIDLSPTLVHGLKKHKLASGANNLDLVFSNSDGKPLCPDNMVKRQFLPALRRAKIRDIRFHDLRRTNVALRIEQGQNIFYISKQIGHASVKTTLDVYGHLLKEVHAEQAQKLDTILGFVEQPGNPSESVRRMLEDSPVTKEKGAAVYLQPLEMVGSGGRI